MQAQLIQDIFHAKVQQTAIAVPGMFFTRVHDGTQDHMNGRFVEGRTWDGTGILKSADRSIEKFV
jgi:protein gp37